MKKKKQGFTLIEMIIVMALTTLILGIISSVFITGNKVFSDSDVKSTLQIEAQAIQENISKVGMESIGIQGITDEDGENSISEDTEIVSASYEQLESKLTDINGTDKEKKWLSITQMKMNPYVEKSNGDIVIGTPITIIDYEKQDNQEMGTISIYGKELSSNVASVRIKYNNETFKDTNSILINIVLIKNGYSNVKYPMSIEVKFRNNFVKQS